MMLAVATEVTKRVEMRNVNSFAALFAQFRLFPRALRPLADAALDLVTTSTTVSIRSKGALFLSYRSECKGYSFDLDGCKVFIKDNPVVLLVLEPREIDGFLNNGVSIWITWAPAQVGYL